MRVMRVTLILLVLVLLGCTEGGSAAGTYELVSIDGNPLPYTPEHEGGAPEIRGATITLNGDGTFIMTMHYTVPPDETISLDYYGTYTADKGSLVFTWEGAGTTPATLEGRSLTINNEGLAFTFER